MFPRELGIVPNNRFPKTELHEDYPVSPITTNYGELEGN